MANTEKFHSGYFEITDAKGSMGFKVEIEKGVVVKPYFQVVMSEFRGKEGVSVSFNSLELRALSHALKYNGEYYEKHSGGAKRDKMFIMENSSKTESILFKIIHNRNLYSTQMPKFLMQALGEEIQLLVDEAMKNCYKTQQHFKRH